MEGETVGDKGTMFGKEQKAKTMDMVTENRQKDGMKSEEVLEYVTEQRSLEANIKGGQGPVKDCHATEKHDNCWDHIYKHTKEEQMAIFEDVQRDMQIYTSKKTRRQGAVSYTHLV